MKYLKYLQTAIDFESFKNSEDYVTPNVSYVEETNGVSYEPYVPKDMSGYLTIEALEDGLTASLSINACEYCVDGDDNWKTLDAGTVTESINTGQTLSFRGNLTPKSYSGIGKFTINKKCNLKGNCMSMLFGDNAIDNYSLSGKDYVFYELFYKCENIVNVSENFLPATTLAFRCYERMFANCASLTTAPELPATVLANWCYDNMFYNCTSLIAAPELPATTIAEKCYEGMFEGCTSLTSAPSILPATTLRDYCYSHMFYGCTSLTTAPELSATTIRDYCCESMFKGCTSLITAPSILPATTLKRECYRYMFSGCTSLTTAPVLPATELGDSCYSYMFSGCTSLITAPVLPATELVSNCYRGMFMRCSKLNYIKMLATDLGANSLYDWVYDVTSKGTFVKNSAMTSLPTGVSGIPSRWTVQNA